MRVLVLGSSGMAGHLVGLYMHEMGWDVTGAARTLSTVTSFPTRKVDLEHQASLQQLVDTRRFDAVINCVGVLNADAANHPSRAVFLNSYLPHWLVERCQSTSTRVVHLSTDCVFSGRTGSYRENSYRDGDTFYDRSKALGEFLNSKDLVFRQSIVGPDIRPTGIGLLNWFLQHNNPVQGYANAFWNGITTLELARGIVHAIQQPLTGLYHLVAPEPIAKSDLLALFRVAFGHPRAIQAVNLPMAIDKTLTLTRSDFSFRPRPYPEQIEELATWTRAHSHLYPHYPCLARGDWP